MCLSEVWTDEQMNEWLAGQGEVIEVWKVVQLPHSKYQEKSSFHAFVWGNSNGFKDGHNIDEIDPLFGRLIEADSKTKYHSGFHFFAGPPFCSSLPHHITIKCLVKKEWITAIGEEFWRKKEIVIVTSQAIFPQYPETEARMEDFAQAVTSGNNPVVNDFISGKYRVKGE